MLRLEGLSRKVGSRLLVRGIDLSVPAGALVSILGPTGSGKTTLLRLVLGLEAPDAGRLYCDGELLAEAGRNLCPAHQRGFSMVLQQAVLLPFSSVDDNVHLGVRRRDASSRARADALYQMLGLAGLERRSAWKLSGGEQQRVAIARALMVASRLLLLDEPFNHLDAPFKRVLLPALARYLRDEQISAILVTHDCREAFVFSDRLGVLSTGRLLQYGDPETLYRQPRDYTVATALGACNALEAGAARALFGERAGDGDEALLRPEQLTLSQQPPHNGELIDSRFVGSYALLEFQCDDGPSLTIQAPPGRFEIGTRYRVVRCSG